jgi:hypothetical protein
VVTRTIDNRTVPQKILTYSLIVVGSLSLILAFALRAREDSMPAIPIGGERATVPLTVANETRLPKDDEAEFGESEVIYPEDNPSVEREYVEYRPGHYDSPTFAIPWKEGKWLLGGGGRPLPQRAVTCNKCNAEHIVAADVTELRCSTCGARIQLEIILFC